MKLSTRVRYGTRALLDLALQPDNSPVLLKDIASRQNISLQYLEHIIGPLVNSGIVKSTRGVNGGMQLDQRPEDIKIGEVVRLLEGNSTPVDCIGNPESCNRSHQCVARDVWCEMKRAIDETLNSVTLKDLIERQKKNR